MKDKLSGNRVSFKNQMIVGVGMPVAVHFNVIAFPIGMDNDFVWLINAGTAGYRKDVR